MERKQIDTVKTVDFEFRQMLEDDAGMRIITPMEKIEEHLKRLFGNKLVSDWKKENESTK